jgi:hypothetical protein
LQTRVPPAKLPEPRLIPLSIDGWIATVIGLSSLGLTFLVFDVSALERDVD